MLISILVISSRLCKNDFIDSINRQRLEEDRKEATRQGNYEVAEQLKLKIAELKLNLSFTKKNEVNMKHQTELQSLEELFRRETTELESWFDNQVTTLQEKSKSLEEKLNLKHQKEMEELYNYLDQKLPKAVKYSKKYIDLKNQETNLAKQQNYKEAILIRKKCEELDRIDTEKFNQDKTDKIKSQSIKTANKHLNEKNALKKKIELEFEELSKRKLTQLNTLHLKYKNRRTELIAQQKGEQTLCENNNLLKAKTTTGKIKSRQHIFNETFSSYNKKR